MKLKTSHSQTKLSKLLEVAGFQQGLFTAVQAKEAGFLPTNFTYHVQNSGWVREMRGIYRLKNFPQDQVKAQYVLYSLWSRDCHNKPQGIFSHETALSIYELSDVMPSKIHMTVPKTFRKWAKTPKSLILHLQAIKKRDTQNWEGVTVTKPLRTILDLMEERKTSMEFIEQAFIEGVKRGLIPINLKGIDDETKKTFQTWLKHSRKLRA